MDHKTLSVRVAAKFLMAYDEPGKAPGSVQPFLPTNGTGSQVPPAHDNQGKPITVETKGMMDLPGYEWHDKSEEFHKLASGKSKNTFNAIGAGPDAIKKGTALEILDTKVVFTSWGSKPFVESYLVVNPNTGEQIWALEHNFKPRPANFGPRVPIDEALKIVLKALKPFNLKRPVARVRGERELRGDASYSAVVEALKKAGLEKIKTGFLGQVNFNIPVQVGTDTFEDYQMDVNGDELSDVLYVIHLRQRR